MVGAVRLLILARTNHKFSATWGGGGGGAQAFELK